MEAITRAEYEEMIESGLLGKEDRVELINGTIVALSPVGSLHVDALTELTHRLIMALNRRALVQVRAPFPVDDQSEPQPDLAVVPAGNYRHERASRAFLIIEVADSSLAFDRAKAKLYAHANVPEYWIVNLAESVVEVHLEPVEHGYRTIHRLGRGENITLSAFADVAIPVAAIFAD